MEGEKGELRGKEGKERKKVCLKKYKVLSSYQIFDLAHPFHKHIKLGLVLIRNLSIPRNPLFLLFSFKLLA
jgi:hypothetical protein